MTADPTLSADRRERLLALADVLVPAADGMPSAREVDPSGRWIERALAARPDLAQQLEPVVAELGDEPPADAVARLETNEENFAALLEIVLGAYYMNRKVWKRIDYPGRRPTPPYPDEADYLLRDGLLDPVRERGAMLFRERP